jgi:flagellar biosynthesis protein FliR
LLPGVLLRAALAYTLAALTPGVMVAMPVMCFILIISLILCGFMIRAPAVPVYW